MTQLTETTKRYQQNCLHILWTQKLDVFSFRWICSWPLYAPVYKHAPDIMRRYSAGVLLCYRIETADTKNLWLRKYMNHNLTEVHTKEDTLQSAQKTVLCVVWRLNKIWHCASLPICQEDNSEMWPFLWSRSQIYLLNLIVKALPTKSSFRCEAKNGKPREKPGLGLHPWGCHSGRGDRLQNPCESYFEAN